MLLRMFSIFDTKSSFFNTPFFFAHQGQAVRACMDLGADQSTTIGRYPEDFVLFDLGSFDDSNGVFTSAMPQNLGPIASFLRPQPPLPFVQHGPQG